MSSLIYITLYTKDGVIWFIKRTNDQKYSATTEVRSDVNVPATGRKIVELSAKWKNKHYSLEELQSLGKVEEGHHFPDVERETNFEKIVGPWR